MENNKLKIYEIEGIEALKSWFASCKNVLDGQTFEDYKNTRNWDSLQELIQKANNYVRYLIATIQIFAIFILRTTNKNQFNTIYNDGNNNRDQTETSPFICGCGSYPSRVKSS